MLIQTLVTHNIIRPKAVMSAILIPLSVMFPDILACRLILDLRQRGFEISQPTTATMEQQGMHRSLPLHIVDGSRSTMFDSMPSHGQASESKISFPPGTLNLASLSARSQMQSSSSDFTSSPATPGGDGRRLGYGPPSVKTALLSRSIRPVVHEMPPEKTRQNSSGSVESDVPELRDLDLEQVDLGAPERHEQSHVEGLLNRESEYSDNSKESDRSGAEQYRT